MIDVRKTMYNFHEFNMFLLKIQQNNMVVVPSTHQRAASFNSNWIELLISVFSETTYLPDVVVNTQIESVSGLWSPDEKSSGVFLPTNFPGRDTLSFSQDDDPDPGAPRLVTDAVSSSHLQRPRESQTEHEDQEEEGDAGEQEEERGQAQEKPATIAQESEAYVEG